MFDQFTLGIEEEFQIVDPETRELRSHVSEILEEGKLLLGEKIKPEMIQSMIEVGTGVCANIQEASEDITKFRCIISSLARKKGMEIVAASTHPFSKWSEQEIYDGDRYKLLVDELQMVARSLLIFGVHVHVGVKDLDKRIQIMNAARYFLPHVLALTTSSPFWLGFNTGLKSYRCEVFKKFPQNRYTRSFRVVPAVSELRRPVGQNELHPERLEDLVGRTAASIFFRRSSFASATFRPESTTRSPLQHCFQAIVAKLHLLTERISVSASIIVGLFWKINGGR